VTEDGSTATIWAGLQAREIQDHAHSVGAGGKLVPNGLRGAQREAHLLRQITGHDQTRILPHHVNRNRGGHGAHLVGISRGDSSHPHREPHHESPQQAAEVLAQITQHRAAPFHA
jgi:hypothetical protein